MDNVPPEEAAIILAARELLRVLRAANTDVAADPSGSCSLAVAACADFVRRISPPREKLWEPLVEVADAMNSLDDGYVHPILRKRDLPGHPPDPMTVHGFRAKVAAAYAVLIRGTPKSVWREAANEIARIITKFGVRIVYDKGQRRSITTNDIQAWRRLYAKAQCEYNDIYASALNQYIEQFDTLAAKDLARARRKLFDMIGDLAARHIALNHRC